MISAYLMVYSSVPSSLIRSSLFGIVMLWATDFFPLWKNVSGVQILLAIRLLRRSTAIGPLNFSRSSLQLCLKNTSMVYSYRKKKEDRQKNMNKWLSFLSYWSFMSIFPHNWFKNMLTRVCLKFLFALFLFFPTLYFLFFFF